MATINKKDLKIEWYRGQGKGGQHRNKTENACRLTHIPTSIQANADCRKRTESYREALNNLNEKVASHFETELSRKKKVKRDNAIRNSKIIRTYNFKRQEVKDHRTGKVVPLKRVLDGDLDCFLRDK